MNTKRLSTNYRPASFTYISGVVTRVQKHPRSQGLSRPSLRSRRLVRAGKERASFEETPAQMPMINLFFSEESSEKLPIGQSR